ncbi:MAG: 2-succinyl-5-enolpyruvyl-6-hydroxy-3-cyclohexene-1-carboxylate synthase [Bacteroidales bacterium]|nr:2-succinyl-5-enolpyruvyl-6-hydroxy-3-cyclohexene-1-carboxylate synthase [Bacteroidales bacterium]
MSQYYTDEKNVQILISLLKQHGIKRIIASPGSTNVTFVGSCQQDPYFEMYSCVDERSAAYMACGIAAQTKEPVVISCTGATASRNYFSALTEAFYRRLPILAVTSTQDENRIGHLIPQVIDRSCQPKDIVKMSVHLQNVKDKEDEWDCMIKANKAILELWHHGFGPVHINLSTRYSADFSVKELPTARKINRITISDDFPAIKHGKTAIYIGSHLRFEEKEIAAIERFCETYNAAVFTDVTSNYTGKYRVPYDIVSCQQINTPNRNPELLIHIGDMSDQAYKTGQPKEVWRVCESGEIQDRYRTLTNVFEMSERDFFEHYTNSDTQVEVSYYQLCMDECNRLWNKIPELPFSHIWIASQMYNKLPENSILHLGILSPLRSWSYFNMNPNIEVYCNQGGFGIDGNMSSMIGASLAAPDKLFFAVVGDLSFFYDMNVIGNRHIKNNIRILLINNALAAEFHLFKQENFKNVDDISKYLAAGGHYGQKSPNLVRHYAEDLGFEYLSAIGKDDFLAKYEHFVTPDTLEKPMIFEAFTDVEDENQALWNMWNIEHDTSFKGEAKQFIKNIVGKNTIEKLKGIVGK